MNECIHPKEKVLFTICAIVSVIISIIMIVSTFGMILIYFIIGTIMTFILQGFFIGTIKGNAIKVSENQLPQVYEMTKELCVKMEMVKVPEVYILQSGGMLNAFATRFAGRDFVVIYSDVLELAYEKGEDAVKFVVCHELAHIKRKHMLKHLIIAPATIIPFLGAAYSRACEYTCDAFAAKHVAEGAVNGLLALAGGKVIYKDINIEEFCKQAVYENGFWTTLAEAMSSHPHLTKRVKVINDMKSTTTYKEIA